MKRILFIIFGTITLSLGVVGIFLPVLPTTPFLLLSAACYLRSSKRLYDWLVNHKVLGVYVKSYIEYKAITVKAKVISITALWLTISSSAIFFVSKTWVRILLFVIAAGVTVYLLSVKTLTKEMQEQLEQT